MRPLFRKLLVRACDCVFATFIIIVKSEMSTVTTYCHIGDTCSTTSSSMSNMTIVDTFATNTTFVDSTVVVVSTNVCTFWKLYLSSSSSFIFFSRSPVRASLGFAKSRLKKMLMMTIRNLKRYGSFLRPTWLILLLLLFVLPLQGQSPQPNVSTMVSIPNRIPGILCHLTLSNKFILR